MSFRTSRFCTILVFLCWMQTAKSHAETWSYSVDYIQGESDAQGIKVGGQYYSGFIKQYFEHAELFVEMSINFWEYGSPNEYDTNLVLAFSPVIVYPLGQVFEKDLFVEFGIGVSLLSDTTFAGKDVGSHYQFEDRLGIMTKFGENNNQRIALRYFHYSNAGLSEQNPGLDFISISYQRFF